MSELVRLVVQEPTMKKRGEKDDGSKWELWSFKAVTPDDGKTHTINTFWKKIDHYTGKEVVGSIASESKTLKDGTPYIARTFRPDQKWEDEMSGQTTEDSGPTAAEQKPSFVKPETQAIYHSGEKSGPGIPSRIDIIPWAAEKAHEIVKCLVMKDIAKDADIICDFFDVIASKYVDIKLAMYCNPDIFAPNDTPQERSDTPGRIIDSAKDIA